MEDDNRFSYFFLGLGLGVAAGLLLAPKTGEEMRNLVRSRIDEGRELLKQRTSDLAASAEDVIERGRSTVTRQRDTLTAAMEAGKQAYRQAVRETPAEQGG